MHCSLSHSNRNVFRSHLNSLNCPISTCGWRNSTGKVFHSRGHTEVVIWLCDHLGKLLRTRSVSWNKEIAGMKKVRTLGAIPPFSRGIVNQVHLCLN